MQISDKGTMFTRLSGILASLAVFCLCLLTAAGPAGAQLAPAPSEPAAEGAAEPPPAAPPEETAAADSADGGIALPPEILDPQIDTQELDYRLVPLTKEELAALAAEWLAIVKAKTEEVMEAQVAISRTEGDVEEAARGRLTRGASILSSGFPMTTPSTTRSASCAKRSMRIHWCSTTLSRSSS